MIARLLNKFTSWALSKNAAGGYGGEDDPRWAYTIETAGDKYLTRVLFTRLLKLRDKLGVGIYLHKFHRHDIDRHLHNHPWKWAFSIILSGSYTEERLEAVVDLPVEDDCDSWPMPPKGLTRRETLTDTRRVRWFNFLTDADYHAVKELHGDVFTLFIVGPRTQDWGFLVDGKHTPWRKYLGKEK